MDFAVGDKAIFWPVVEIRTMAGGKAVCVWEYNGKMIEVTLPVDGLARSDTLPFLSDRILKRSLENGRLV